MSEVWAVLLDLNTLRATLRMSTPLALAAVGGAVSERAGVINLGLEGMMLGGAFGAVLGSYLTASPWAGLLGALVAGAALGALLGLFALVLRADHVVAGVAVNILSLGLTTWLMQVIWATRGTSPQVPPLPRWTVPLLADVPVLGELLGTHSPPVYAMVVLVPLAWLVLFRTPLGLRIRMIGEHPAAAATVGIPVYRVQLGCVIASGALAGLGGAYLSLGHLSWFSLNMTAGRGYMALAANIFGQWNPVGAFLASLLFAFTDAVQLRLQTLQLPWPTELIQMLPYVLTLAVLAGAVIRSRPPAALGRHYVPDQGG